MFSTETAGILLQTALMVGLGYPLGKYIAKVYKGERTCTDFLKPVERALFKFSGINPAVEMSWRQFVTALLAVSLLWFGWAMTLLLLQGHLPLNPDGNSGQSWHQAFCTSVSFLANCNLQHYSGESGLTYLTQILVVMFLQFVTAATGLAVMAGAMKALAERQTQTLGNFWRYLVLGCTRILLPLSLAVGLLLVAQGVPMTFEGRQETATLEGARQQVAQGPVAAVVAIKQLGTNGGGYFGANAAHPLENPSYLTQTVECVSLLLLPVAVVFAFGFYTRRRKLAWTIFAVMFIAFAAGAAISVGQETAGNPRLAQSGISQDGGAMEGKEVRFGAAATALWSAATTASSNGSVSGMHGSMMPLSQTVQLLNMQANTWFGGVGVGWLNYFTFLLIAVFISGLMVGRTPELFGKKVEVREMKIAALIALLHPFLILTGTALSAYLLVHTSPNVATGHFHGLSEMLYEFTSSAANNGSGLEDLADNTPYWNIGCGVVILLGRYLPIIGQLGIVALLARKKFVPASAGTLQTDTGTFGVMTLAVIVVVAALAFFPALALSTLAEHLAV